MAPSVIVIAGPTASGKTRLAIELARRCGGEIVSADSMQIYRRMDIGTAKATPEERSAAPHHMLDVADPEEAYSVSRYVEEAAACCDAILTRGRIPILAGGTGLYIDSLVSGRSFAGEAPDNALRESLDREYEILGGDAMLQQLAAFDPERAAKLHPGDRRRILRAIEIYRLTGKTATEHDAATRALPPRYRAHRIVLNFADRADLYARIDRRVELMVEQGLFREVEELLRSGLSPEHTSMQAIGYKEAAAALRGEMSREEAISLIQLNSRRYAKRQLTWFGRWEGCCRILWGPEPDFSAAVSQCGSFLSAADPEAFHNCLWEC